jgi:hypothetical protein
LNNKITTKQLIKQLSQFDPDAYILFDDGTSLRYVTRIESDEAISLSDDDMDVLSNYIDLLHMESTYLEDGEDSALDFFSVAVLS